MKKKVALRLREFIDSQYSNPRGVFGMYIGEKMVRQHRPETLWSIQQMKFHQSEKILELGCGAGFAMKLLLEQSSINKVVGLDLSQSILRSASIRNRSQIKRGRARLVQSNVNQLDFPDEYFTKAFSIHSVYFWDNLSKTILEIYRVLKPEGTILLTLCDGKNGEISDNIKILVEQEIIPNLKQCGFRNIQLLKGPDSRQFHTIAVKADK